MPLRTFPFLLRLHSDFMHYVTASRASIAAADRTASAIKLRSAAGGTSGLSMVDGERT